LFVTEQCDRLGMTELAETARLLASELVTNVVVHTQAEPTIAVASTCGRLLVEVRDDDAALPADPGDPAAEIGLASGGRGLTLVAQMAEDWGVRPIEGDGKGIWFSLLPGQPPPDAATCGCTEPMYDAVASH
jgi:anti-sigma regulatory factor (Ser/Thr protein kinase)